MQGDRIMGSGDLPSGSIGNVAASPKKGGKGSKPGKGGKKGGGKKGR